MLLLTDTNKLLKGDLKIMEDNEKKTEKGLGMLESLYATTINGVQPLSKPVEEFATEYLEKYGSNKEKAIQDLVKNQIIKLSTTGFVTGLGGLITLPVSIPADMASSYYVQLRMIAAIAYICGNDIESDSVKTLSYTTLVGAKISDILKQTGIKVSAKMAKKALEKLPGKIFIKINQKLGFRFITKAGTKGVVNLTKVIPVIPGLVSAAWNAVETKLIAERAKNAFLIAPESSDCTEYSYTVSDDVATTPEQEKLSDEENLAKAVIGTAVALQEAGHKKPEDCAEYLADISLADFVANIEKGNELFQKFLDKSAELDNEFNENQKNDEKLSADMWNAIDNI